MLFQWFAVSQTKQLIQPKNSVALPKAAGNSQGQLPPNCKRQSGGCEDFSILCSRPALRCRAGRLSFWIRKTQKHGEHKFMSQQSVPDGNSIERSIDVSELPAKQVDAAANSIDCSIDTSELLQEQVAAENSIETGEPAASAEQIAASNSGESAPEAEKSIVKIMLFGSQRGVFKTIHALYLMGFAQVGDWVRFVGSYEKETKTKKLNLRIS